MYKCCKDEDGKPLEFDKEDFITIKDKSNILSVQEKLAVIKAFENKLVDPENDDEGSKNSNRKRI